MTEIKEYTGRLTINLDVTLSAKSEKEALELLENIYPDITLSYGENVPDYMYWSDDIDTAEWEIED
ncbi:MAG: hypothetical protein ACOVOQ_08360 [Flavobacterium sp.]|jgi:hypothetical protein